jgi:integrase
MARRAKGEGCLMRRAGSRFWWAQFYQDGKAVRKSTGKAVKEEALSVLRRIMGDAERGLPVTDGSLRYDDLRRALIDNYVTKGNKSLAMLPDGTETITGLSQLDKACGWSPTEPGIKISKLTTEWTRKFQRERLAESAGPSIINRSLQALRRGLNILREDGKLAVVPKIRLLKEPSARQGFIEPVKFEELLAALPSHLRPLVATLYYTGARRGEALLVEWEQVDLRRREITLRDSQTKTSEPRVLPLPSRVVALLQDIEPKRGKVFDATNLRVEWERAVVAVGLGTREKIDGGEGKQDWYRFRGLRLHDLRRSAVRNLIKSGAPEKVCMKISGHKTRDVFDRYHIVVTADLHAAMRVVETASLALPSGEPEKSTRKGKLSVQSGRLTGRKVLQPA